MPPIDKMGLSRRSVASSGVLLHQTGLYIVVSKREECDAEITRWQQALDAVSDAQGRAERPTREE